jgi:hypothetical protein
MSGVKSVRTILLRFNETLDKHRLVPNFLKEQQRDIYSTFYHPQLGDHQKDLNSLLFWSKIFMIQAQVMSIGA